MMNFEAKQSGHLCVEIISFYIISQIFTHREIYNFSLDTIYSQINGFSSFKAGVGTLFLVLLGKKSTIIFQYIVIKVIWEKTRLQHLLLALFHGLESLWRETLANHRERVFLLAVLPMQMLVHKSRK